MSMYDQIHKFIDHNPKFIKLPFVEEVVEVEYDEKTEEEKEIKYYELSKEYKYICYYKPNIENIFSDIISSEDGFVIGHHERFGIFIDDVGSDRVPFFLHNDRSLEKLLFRIIQTHHSNQKSNKVETV